MALGMVAIFCLYGLSSPVNWSSPVRATVIDEQTGKPIAGAAVAAAWWPTNFFGSKSVITHRATAITDARGQFVLDGMRLRIRRPWTWYDVDDPIIYLYAPGYETQRLNNVPLAGSFAGPYDRSSARRRCFWNGKTIAMAPVKTAEQELEQLQAMQGYSDGDFRPDQYPDIWVTIVAGWNRLPAAQQRASIAGNPNEHVEYWKNQKP
jgi:hypothetical protein